MKCFECGIEVTREGMCFLCVASIVQRNRESILGNRPCPICKRPLDSEGNLIRFWRSKGGVIEARIHVKCDAIARFKKTYSTSDPRRKSMNKTFAQRQSDIREEKETMRLQKQQTPRAFVYFNKDGIGEYIVGRVVKSYMQEPHGERSYAQRVTDIDSAVVVGSETHKIRLCVTDNAVNRDIEDHISGPTSIVGSFILAIFVGFVEGANGKSYKDIRTFASKDFSELLREAMEDSAVAELSKRIEGWSLGPATLVAGLDVKVSKALGLAPSGGSDDIPF